MTQRNARIHGWVFPLFSPDSDGRLSLNFHRFVIWYRSCDTRALDNSVYRKGPMTLTVTNQIHGAPRHFLPTWEIMVKYIYACKNFSATVSTKICFPLKGLCIFLYDKKTQCPQIYIKQFGKWIHRKINWSNFHSLQMCMATYPYN